MPGKGSTFSFSVWLTLPDDSASMVAADFKVDTAAITGRQLETLENDMSMSFGSKENIEEIDRRLMKLVLCVEMDTWDKAETFADALKQLTIGAPKEISTTALKLKMAVQKENKEKTTEAIDMLRAALGSIDEDI